ncbi:MAG: phosphatase PAP2 family protein [Verrucomicrobia bacterium]|nr:phosphatase PAP2 family protein [Verrucomicrobiota bacterium]
MEVALKKKILFLFSVLLVVVGSFFMDAPVRRAVVEWQGTTWNSSSEKKIVAAVSRYGDWPELMLLGIIGFFAARRARSQRWQKIFLCAMLASTVAGAMVNMVRLTTGRTRPRVTEQHWYGPYHEGKWTIGNAECNSFPSGHTATAVGFAAVILFASPCWGIVAMVFAAGVAGSRLLLGAHHPSDLIVAVCLALGIAWLFWNYMKNRSLCWNE